MNAATFYIALIHKDADSDFGVSFPDFPGCVSAGETLAEAAAMGREALEGHVALMIEDDQAIPEPSSMDAILADPDNRDGTPAMIPLSASILQKAKAVRVNITMPEDALREIDRYAEEHGFTRSGFLAQAAKRMMGEVSRGDAGWTWARSPSAHCNGTGLISVWLHNVGGSNYDLFRLAVRANRYAPI